MKVYTMCKCPVQVPYGEIWFLRLRIVKSNFAKNISSNFWVGMVKNRFGPLDHGTIKSAVSQESFN